MGLVVCAVVTQSSVNAALCGAANRGGHKLNEHTYLGACATSWVDSPKSRAFAVTPYSLNLFLSRRMQPFWNGNKDCNMKMSIYRIYGIGCDLYSLNIVQCNLCGNLETEI